MLAIFYQCHTTTTQVTLEVKATCCLQRSSLIAPSSRHLCSSLVTSYTSTKSQLFNQCSQAHTRRRQRQDTITSHNWNTTVQPVLNNWSKNFEERPQCRLVALTRFEWIRPTLIPFDTWFLGPTRQESAPNCISTSSAASVFGTAHSRDSTCFSNGMTTSINCPSSGPPSNTWFLRPTQVSPANGILIC